MPATRTIVAVGGHQLDHVELTGFVVELAATVRPNVLFLPTASGDNPDYVGRFYQAFAVVNCAAAHLPLFDRPDDIESPISRAHVIVVAGGNTKNMLLVWREHGVDRALRAAYERGAILTGWSAGCICWFEDGITDSYGSTLRPLRDGLGWLEGSACPHYDGEPTRRPTYTRAVRERTIKPGIAADDAVALVYRDERFVEAVSPRADGHAYAVGPDGERSLAVRVLT